MNPFSQSSGLKNALGIDLGEVHQNRRRNALSQENTVLNNQAAKMNEYKLQAAQQQQQNAPQVNALSRQFYGATDPDKARQIGGQLAGMDPSQVEQIRKHIDSMDDATKAKTAAKAEALGKRAHALLQIQDDNEFDKAFVAGMTELYRTDPTAAQGAPEMDRPTAERRAWAQEQFNEILTTAQYLDSIKPDAGKWGSAQEVTGPDGKPMLVQIETNTGEVRPVNGVGPKLGKGMKIVSNGEGGFTIETNASSGGETQEPTTSTKSKLQKSLADLDETVARVANIRTKLYDEGGKFKREFLTWRGKLGNQFSEWLDKGDVGLSEEDRTALRDYKKFQMSVDREFNAYRKEITGAAAAQQELEALKKAMFNTDNSPEQFEAAFEEYEEGLLRSMRIKRRILREGFQVGSKEYSNKSDRLWGYEGDDSAADRVDELVKSGLSREEALDQSLDEGYTK